ncbi:MAG: hypothetical protein RMX96_08940 [Nostoc sp. ChiSLP02]|nr:hypothetical protein [Nostoc sp. DedSLP05]MDZ8184965.1 hypothetical protein [Nostoc sp. ChiSLP02]
MAKIKYAFYNLLNQTIAYWTNICDRFPILASYSSRIKVLANSYVLALRLYA